MELGSSTSSALGVVHARARGHAFLNLIGRCGSRAVTVDLNTLMSSFGGGAVWAAAAASVRRTGASRAPRRRIRRRARRALGGGEGRLARTAARLEAEVTPPPGRGAADARAVPTSCRSLPSRLSFARLRRRTYRCGYGEATDVAARSSRQVTAEYRESDDGEHGRARRPDGGRGRTDGTDQEVRSARRRRRSNASRAAIKPKDAVKAARSVAARGQRVKAWALTRRPSRCAAPPGGSPAAPATAIARARVRSALDASARRAPFSVSAAGLGLRRDREHLPHTDLRPHRRRRRDRQAAGAAEDDVLRQARPGTTALSRRRRRREGGERKWNSSLRRAEGARRARRITRPTGCRATQRLTPRPTRRRGR